MKKRYALAAFLTSVSFTSQATTTLPATDYVDAHGDDHVVICNSARNILDCSDVTMNYLEQLAHYQFADAGQNQAAHFVIIDGDTGSVSRVRVDQVLRGSQRSYQIEAVEPVPRDLALAEQTFALETEIRALSTALNFTKSTDDAPLLNAAGQTLNDAWFGGDAVNPAELNVLSNCPTAYSWMVNDRPNQTAAPCRSFLQRQVDLLSTEASQGVGLLTAFYQQLNAWQDTFHRHYTSAQVPDYSSFRIQFGLADNSRLVLAVNLVGQRFNAAIDQASSRAASGESLRDFHETLASLAGFQQIAFHEAAALFGRFDCGTSLSSLATDQFFQIQLLESDGPARPSRVRFSVLEQANSDVESFECVRS